MYQHGSAQRNPSKDGDINNCDRFFSSDPSHAKRSRKRSSDFVSGLINFGVLLSDVSSTLTKIKQGLQVYDQSNVFCDSSLTTTHLHNTSPNHYTVQCSPPLLDSEVMPAPIYPSGQSIHSIPEDQRLDYQEYKALKTMCKQMDSNLANVLYNMGHMLSSLNEEFEQPLLYEKDQDELTTQPNTPPSSRPQSPCISLSVSPMSSISEYEYVEDTNDSDYGDPFLPHSRD